LLYQNKIMKKKTQKANAGKCQIFKSIKFTSDLTRLLFTCTLDGMNKSIAKSCQEVDGSILIAPNCYSVNKLIDCNMYDTIIYVK